MRLNLHFESAGLFLGLLLLGSCRTMADFQPLSLPRLAAGSESPAATIRLAGTLTGNGECLRVGGHDSAAAGINGVVVWPLSGDGSGIASDINVIVIWPHSATAQHRGSDAAGINGVVIWPRAARRGTPVRLGERIELDGEMKDDVSGLRLERPVPRGCSGRAFVVREFRPAPAP